jgi:hypothetical protein
MTTPMLGRRPPVAVSCHVVVWEGTGHRAQRPFSSPARRSRRRDDDTAYIYSTVPSADLCKIIRRTRAGAVLVFPRARARQSWAVEPAAAADLSAGQLLLRNLWRSGIRVASGMSRRLARRHESRANVDAVDGPLAGVSQDETSRAGKEQRTPRCSPFLCGPDQWLDGGENGCRSGTG